jgi:23S rRNA (guanosine2251-2'-O)-methyltransferase
MSAQSSEQDSDRAGDLAVLEGAVSVQAALESRSREIVAIYIQREKQNRPIVRLERFAKSQGLTIERVDAAEIEAHTEGRTHGGVIALVGPRRFQSLDALIEDRKRPFVVMLDGIEDPFNFGAAVRALYASGVDGLVVRPRNWMSAAGIVARSSAGATELLPTAVAETAADAAAFFRARGLTIACATKENAVPVYQADLTVATFLAIGGEKRGITRSFLRQADLHLSIPYQRRFPRSLGTASAVAVLAFEAMRQRQAAPTAENPSRRGLDTAATVDGTPKRRET